MTLPLRTDAIPAPVDPPRHFVRVGRFRIAYTDEGPADALPVIMIHGVPGSVADFRYLGPQVGTQLRVLRVDMLGFGESTRTALAHYGFEARGKLVVRFARALGLGRYALVSHSMGGPVAMSAAAEDPENVVALMLIASPGFRKHRGLRGIPRFFGPMVLAGHVPPFRGLFVDKLRRVYAHLKFPGVFSARDLLAHARVISALRFDRIARVARRIKAPTLVVFSQDDHLLEADIGVELAAGIPGAERLEYADGGHNLQKTKAVELALRVFDLVESAQRL